MSTLEQAVETMITRNRNNAKVADVVSPTLIVDMKSNLTIMMVYERLLQVARRFITHRLLINATPLMKSLGKCKDIDIEIDEVSMVVHPSL